MSGLIRFGPILFIRALRCLVLHVLYFHPPSSPFQRYAERTSLSCTSVQESKVKQSTGKYLLHFTVLYFYSSSSRSCRFIHVFEGFVSPFLLFAVVSCIVLRIPPCSSRSCTVFYCCFASCHGFSPARCHCLQRLGPCCFFTDQPLGWGEQTPKEAQATKREN